MLVGVEDRLAQRAGAGVVDVGDGIGGEERAGLEPLDGHPTGRAGGKGTTVSTVMMITTVPHGLSHCRQYTPGLNDCGGRRRKPRDAASGGRGRVQSSTSS